MNLAQAKRRVNAWLMRSLQDFLADMQKPARKQFRNGMIVGVRSGEWWIGARRNFATDSVEIGCFGLTWIIPAEFWRNRRHR